jgi:translation initiation factor 1A
MPKEIKKGGKTKHLKNVSKNNKQDLQYKEEDQVYGKVAKVHGGGRYEVDCFDGIKRLGRVRGSFKNSGGISVGVILLISLREYQDYKCDILLLYSPEEARKLQSLGDVPLDISGDKDIEDKDIGFTFEDI